MLRLRPFAWKSPKTVEETVELLLQHGSKAHLCSGGSDLMPNLKLWQLDAQVLISLTKLPNSKRINIENNVMHIGGMVSLHTVMHDPMNISADSSILFRSFVSTVASDSCN